MCECEIERERGRYMQRERENECMSYVCFSVLNTKFSPCYLCVRDREREGEICRERKRVCVYVCEIKWRWFA